MFYKNFTCALDGIDGYTVTVEADISRGVPFMNIVGLPNASVKESKDRIKSAILNSGLNFPKQKIIINLSPSDIKKEGSHYDLPIALCILSAEYAICSEEYKRSAFVGELSLNGEIVGVKGIVPFIINARDNDEIERIFVPYENIEEAEIVDGIEIIAVKNLLEILAHLRGDVLIPKVTSRIRNISTDFEFDFEDVKGALVAKRASEICAAGNHNMLMIGAAGSGKTLIAKRMTSIMGHLTEEEYLDVSRIYSGTGFINEDILNRKKPFRSPHHTVTMKALIGGGNSSTPGEVVLAHKGVLFLDELLEFDKKTLEALRQPIEDKVITISRIKNVNTYPCDFLLVACCNPCPCGNYNNPYKECTCQEHRIKNYLGRASTPLLDRFDIFVEMIPSNLQEIKDSSLVEKSETMRERVLRAKAIQEERYRGLGFTYNDSIPSKMIESFCVLTDDASDFLDLIFKRNKLSMRSYHKLLRVSRTIADLENSEKIELQHLSEALGFRKPLQKYWG
ncbi:MAG: YifB family Mg chelatase-like AAA ATPase [Peptostreptococcaceae bacterium]|nr:YifB family Mg chelatase-like AAA ATPase [Peptostreptococcaceae bacterium]